MDIPIQAYGATVTEGKEYFFKSGCPIGVENHIHICIFKDNKVFLFLQDLHNWRKRKDAPSFFITMKKPIPFLQKME